MGGGGGGGHSGGMPGDPTRKRKPVPVEIDFTPMIDCMFLLLMFNMIAYTISGTNTVELPEAKYARGADARDAMIVTIVGKGTKEASFHIGDPSKPEASLDDLKEQVEKEVADGSKKVVVKAAKDIPYRFVQEVAAVVGEAGAGLYVEVAQPK